MKKIGSFVFLLPVIAILSACGTESTASLVENPKSASQPVSETAASETEAVTEIDAEKAYLETLPKEDLGGMSFTVLGQSFRERQNFYIEGLEGDVINDAVRARDIAAEERLNIRLVYQAYETVDGRQKVAADVSKAVRAGDAAYDLAITAMGDGINTMVSANVLYDLNTIPHLTLTSEYWDKSIHANMQFYGKQYFTSGPLSVQFYQVPIAVAFNKRLAADYDLSDIYQTVLDGKWTVDYLDGLVKNLSSDINGDGVMTFDDFYGFTWDRTFGNALYVASGFRSVTEENGEYSVKLDDLKSLDIIEKCAGIFGNPDTMFQNLKSDGSSLRLFSEGRALFVNADINSMMSFRDMKDDFGIIPVPKFEEAQETYLSTCNTFLPSGIAVPMTCVDPEKTGLILETMAVLSRDSILPAAYEITLQGKVARDDVSAQMLDIIYGNSSFDFITVFDFGKSSLLLQESVLGIQHNFASSYQKIKKKVDNELNKVMKNSKEGE